MAAAQGSSYWGWNPLHWWSRPNTQCPLTQTCPLIVSFPPELRIWICSYLNPRDRRSMKQVCKHFEIDLNYIYGVDAVLYGPKFRNQRDPDEESELMLLGFDLRKDAALEAKQIKENANWILNVLPQNLLLRRFSGLDFDTRDFVIVPDLVRCLTVDLDHRQPDFVEERLKEVLAYYKNLKRLSLTCQAVEPFIEYEPFNTFGINVADNLLGSLEFNPHLSELSVNVNLLIRVSYLSALDYDAHFAQMIITPEVAATDEWLQNPPKLTKIQIYMPDFPTDHLRRWKMFLDAQDGLIHLKLNFGYLHWNFFRTVLRKNIATLKTLDLVMINWCPEDFSDSDDDEPIQLERFDWDLILPASKLKSLRISTAMNVHGLYHLLKIFPKDWPNPTLNLHLLATMIWLQELVLFGVHLNQFQLRIIFTELQSLKNVELTGWTRTGEAAFLRTTHAAFDDFWDKHWDIFGKEDYTERNQNLCELLNEVLLQRQMQFIKLIDMSLWLCLEVNRYNFLNKLTKSFYTITWPEPPWYSPPSDFYRYPLIMKRN